MMGRSDLHTFTSLRQLIIALEDEQFERVKKGETVQFTYHPLWLQSKLLLVYVGRNPPGMNTRGVREAIRRGWNFAPWKVDDAIIQQLESGDTVPCMKYDGFSVVLGLKRRLEEKTT